MNTAVPGASRKRPSKKKVIKIIAICLAVAILAGGTYVFLRIKSNKSSGTVTQRTAFVTKGDLSNSITGSAPIESANRSELSPKVTATLEKINCKEGDQVKKGDVLFVLDDTDALLAIENAKNDIAQMQLTLDNTAKSVSSLNIKAPFSGQVTNISVKEGDTAGNGGALLTITDMSSLKVTLPFSSSAVKNISTGHKATVFIQDLMLSVDGKVTYISDRPYTTASGGELYSVEITISNPGSLKESMKATAEITVNGATLDSVESGTLSYANSKVLKSDAGGTVTSLKVRENESVTAGETLATLENDSLALSSSSNNMKMENLKAQLKIKQEQLSYYTIAAPFDGTITSMGKANEGDTVSQGTSLAVVSDVSHLQFEVSIDELDISQVAAGQEVNITADALEETATTPLTGKVTKVAMEGTSSNGVTTYPVTVTVDDDCVSKLKTGMNIDAEILISNKTDVLMVPLDAITKMGTKSYVYVKESGSQSGSNQNGANGSYGQNNLPGRGSNTSGAAFGPRSGNTSGAAMNGDFPQGAPPQGGYQQGSKGQNTSRSAIRGQMTGNTSQSAVKGSFARAAQKAAGSDYYAGAALVQVETGISSDSYIEIVSGLTEGQEIVLPKSSTVSSTTTNSKQNNRNGDMGGAMMGGGMPAGGPGGF